MAVPAAVADDKIPDAWFFSGADRPAQLKAIEGKPAPELLTQAWIGDETSIQSSLGKVVVVDFWATWCGPCMASIPHNVELVKKFKDKGLVFIGVHDANAGWDKASQTVKDKAINYPVAHDKGESAKSFAVQFWPTYVAIDHRGIVRAAGLMPDHVDAVVEMLLAEMPVQASTGADAAEWCFGGANRPSWLKQAEGKPAPKLMAAEWKGEELREPDRKGRVVVLVFLSPESELGLRQFAEIAKLDPELGPQGVSIVGVCDARADWAKLVAALEARGIKSPVMRDAPPPPADGKTKPIPLGATASAMGIKLAPAAVVIDRNGLVRACGVRPDKLKPLVNTLLAEPLSDAKAGDSAAPTP